jgi:hypothetical protein
VNLTEGFREQGAEDNILANEEGRNQMLEELHKRNFMVHIV